MVENRLLSSWDIGIKSFAKFQSQPTLASDKFLDVLIKARQELQLNE